MSNADLDFGFRSGLIGMLILIGIQLGLYGEINFFILSIDLAFVIFYASVIILVSKFKKVKGKENFTGNNNVKIHFSNDTNIGFTSEDLDKTRKRILKVFKEREVITVWENVAIDFSKVDYVIFRGVEEE